MEQRLYNTKIIADAVGEHGLRKFGRQCGLNNRTIKRATLGLDLRVSTLRVIAETLGISVCTLITCEGREVYSKSARK